MKLAFIGTGVMGTPMIKNLLGAGHEVNIYNRTPARAKEAEEAGAVLYPSIKDTVEGADAVITMVGFPEDVREVYFGEDGILDSAGPGTLLIDMTTTEPALSKEIYEEAKKRDMTSLDAPVSGGDIGAQNGTLSIMVGGDPEAFAQAEEIFEPLGEQINYMGGPGSGQHTKMANQIAIAGALSGVCEALSYAKSAGLDPAQVIEAVKGGAAGSWQLSNLGPKMIKGDYDPGFYIKHMAKDLRIADKEAKKMDKELEGAGAVLSHFEELGLDDLGTQALFEYYK